MIFIWNLWQKTVLDSGDVLSLLDGFFGLYPGQTHLFIKMAAFGSILVISVSATVRMMVLAAFGAFLAWQGSLDVRFNYVSFNFFLPLKNAGRTRLTQIVFLVLLPCLLWVKLTPSIDIDQVSVLWAAPVFGALHLILNAILGRILACIIKDPSGELGQRHFVSVMTWCNIVSIFSLFFHFFISTERSPTRFDPRHY
jgi:hypothetical protein